MARTFLDKKGYRHFSDSGQSVARWVASKKIGRPLKSEEVVHHGYKGKSVNDPNNLWVHKNQSEHIKKRHGRF